MRPNSQKNINHELFSETNTGFFISFLLKFEFFIDSDILPMQNFQNLNNNESEIKKILCEFF